MSGTECVNSRLLAAGSAQHGRAQSTPHPRTPVSVPAPPFDCCPSGVLRPVPLDAPQSRPPCAGSRYLLRALGAALPAVPAAHPASCVPPAVTLNRPELQPRRLRALNAGRAGPARGPGPSRGRARAGASGAPRQKYLRPGQERAGGTTDGSQDPLMRKSLTGKKNTNN